MATNNQSFSKNYGLLLAAVVIENLDLEVT